jgi:DNA-directed RNA polymerase subunit K/omega
MPPKKTSETYESESEISESDDESNIDEELGEDEYDDELSSNVGSEIAEELGENGNEDEGVGEENESEEDDEKSDEEVEDVELDDASKCYYSEGEDGNDDNDDDVLNNIVNRDVFADSQKDETGVSKIVPDNERLPRYNMTKYERVKVLGERANLISLGAPPLINPDVNMEDLDAEKIALLELQNKETPFFIWRPRAGGRMERWSINELTIVN